MKLYRPEDMPKDYKHNGCGSGWTAKIIPDSIYGLSICMACAIHDYMYEVGKTIADKEEADRVFLNNMIRIIDAKDAWYYPHSLARRRALKYYEAVHNFGGDAYWKGKNK